MGTGVRLVHEVKSGDFERVCPGGDQSAQQDAAMA